MHNELTKTDLTPEQSAKIAKMQEEIALLSSMESKIDEELSNVKEELRKHKLTQEKKTLMTKLKRVRAKKIDRVTAQNEMLDLLLNKFLPGKTLLQKIEEIGFKQKQLGGK